jgi:formate hydrogenlyase subunit 3/multisubunit Na+/H+ antiporter MnhD subunit
LLPAPPKFDHYIKQVAAYLRAREANLLRGQPEHLQQLDQLSDLDLLKKWSWLSAIVGGIASCGVLPLALIVLHSLLPTILLQLLWAVTKVAIGLTCAMFALAIYFTFFMQSDYRNGG